LQKKRRNTKKLGEETRRLEWGKGVENHHGFSFCALVFFSFSLGWAFVDAVVL
jgi:hypothetical protein